MSPHKKKEGPHKFRTRRPVTAQEVDVTIAALRRLRHERTLLNKSTEDEPPTALAPVPPHYRPEPNTSNHRIESKGTMDTSPTTADETLSLNVTQQECELDNDTTALMARLEKAYQRNVSKKAAAMQQARIDEGTEHTDKEQYEDEQPEKEEVKPTKQALKREHSKRSQRSHRSNKKDAASVVSRTSNAPSVLSEQYLESVEDLPFDDDSFAKLMTMSPKAQRLSARNLVAAGSQRGRMQDIREAQGGLGSSGSSTEEHQPPVTEIDLAVDPNTPEYQSQKLGEFLKATGQDERLAAATASAFEAFLLSQEDAMLMGEEPMNKSVHHYGAEDALDAPDEDAIEHDYNELRSRYSKPVDQEPSFPQERVTSYAGRAPRFPSDGNRRQNWLNPPRSQNTSFRSRFQEEMNEEHRRRSRRDDSRSVKEETSSRHSGRISAPPRHPSSESGTGMYYTNSQARRFNDRRNSNDSYVAGETGSTRPEYYDNSRLLGVKSVQRERPPLTGQARNNSDRMSDLTGSSRRSLYSTGKQFDEFGRVRRNESIVQEQQPVVEGKRFNSSRYNNEPTEASKAIDFSGSKHGGNGNNGMTEKTQSVGSTGTSSSRSGQLVVRDQRQAERPVQEQIDELPLEHRACFNALKSKWEQKHGGKKAFTDQMYLRFVRCSLPEPFDFKGAWNCMKRFERRYLRLSIASMEIQLLTKTLFPAPGLKSRQGNDILYMRPSRYFPGKTSCSNLIDSLVYTMGAMLEKEQACAHGIGVVMNMSGWKMANFSVKYWHKLMATLQGRRVPTRVELLLIVNPPSWFGSIWAIMKPMMSEPFRRKVHRISFDEMGRFLMDGYEWNTPDDIQTGRRDTDEMVKKFIAERKVIETTIRA